MLIEVLPQGRESLNTRCRACIKKDPQAIPIKEFKNNIEFSNVSFSYGSEPVLKDINLEIIKGKMVALVGPSGGWKVDNGRSVA